MDFPTARAGTEVKAKTSIRKPGRPRTKDDLRELILKLARESSFGYTRILGELKRLGVRSVSRSTVVNILKDAGLDPSPERKKGTWESFLARHAATLWACDFLSVKAWTAKGLVDLYLLFFLNVKTRKVILSSPTASPTAKWTTQQARNATMRMAELGIPVTHLLIDHDRKFTATFDAVFESEEAEVKRVGPRAPNLNAYAERFVQTLKHECLDHFVVLGDKHLHHLVTEFIAHYHTERPHQGLDNDLIESDGDPPILNLSDAVGEVRCRERLGGLLRHYHRVAA